MELNSNLPEVRSQVVEYVEKVAKMELDAFTLDKMADDLLKRGKDQQIRAYTKMTDQQKEVESAQKKLDEAGVEVEKKQNNLKFRKQDNSVFTKIMFCVVRLPVMIIVAGIISYLIWAIMYEFFDYSNPFLSVVIIPVTITAIEFLIRYKTETDDRSAVVDSANKQLMESIEKGNAAYSVLLAETEKLETYKKEYNSSIEANKIMQKQSEDSRKSAAVVRGYLEKCYAIGVIPPDYRTMDCALTLKEIFNNSGIKTMREAIKEYEEQVFQGEVKKGIEKIYDEWNKLTGSMSYMRDAMQGVRRSILDMGQDMENVSRSLSTEASRQGKMLSQARSARYAAESEKNAMENYERYLEQ